MAGVANSLDRGVSVPRLRSDYDLGPKRVSAHTYRAVNDHARSGVEPRRAGRSAHREVHVALQVADQLALQAISSAPAGGAHVVERCHDNVQRAASVEGPRLLDHRPRRERRHERSDSDAPDRQPDRSPLVLRPPRMPQCPPERRRRGPAVTGAQLQRPTQYAGEIDRNSGPVSSSRLTLIPATGREGLVDHHPGRIDVGALVRDAGELFRRHVRRGPLQDLRIRLLSSAEAPGDAEVRQYRALLVEEDVRWLHIPMDHAFPMRLPERRQQVAPELTRGVDRQAPMLLQMSLEGVPLQVVHHIEVQALTFIDLVDRNDIGVSQIGEDASFADELLDGLDRPQLGPQHLDGHGTREGYVAGQVHRSHAAASELAQQLVLGRQSRTQALKEGRHVTWTGEHPGPRPESQTAPSVAGPFHCGTSVAEVTAP